MFLPKVVLGGVLATLLQIYPTAALPSFPRGGNATKELPSYETIAEAADQIMVRSKGGENIYSMGEVLKKDQWSVSVEYDYY